jgi:hypothetical protein
MAFHMAQIPGFVHFRSLPGATHPALPLRLRAASLRAQAKCGCVPCVKTTRRANQQNLSRPIVKNIPASVVGQITDLTSPVSPDERGVAHVTNARWDAVDAALAKGRTQAARGRRSRVVLAPRCWRQVSRIYPRSDGGKKAGHRGEREVSRKPSRGESRDVPAHLWSFPCAFLCKPAAQGAAGASRHPAFPAPSSHLEGHQIAITRAHRAARSRRCR